MNAKLAKEITESNNSSYIVDVINDISNTVHHLSNLGYYSCAVNLKRAHNFSKEKLIKIIKQLEQKGFKVKTKEPINLDDNVPIGESFIVSIFWNQEHE